MVLQPENDRMVRAANKNTSYSFFKKKKKNVESADQPTRASGTVTSYNSALITLGVTANCLPTHLATLRLKVPHNIRVVGSTDSTINRASTLQSVL